MNVRTLVYVWAIFIIIKLDVLLLTQFLDVEDCKSLIGLSINILSNFVVELVLWNFLSRGYKEYQKHVDLFYSFSQTHL